MTHLFDKVGLGVQPEALARSRPSCTSRPLVRTRLGNRTDKERLDPDPRVVDLLLREAGVDDVDDAVDRERGLGNVGRDDDLATGRAVGSARSRRLVKDALLLLRRERRVERDGLERTELVRQLVGLDRDLSARVLDLLFTGQEDEDVAFWFGLVNHQDGTDRRLEVVGFRFRSVEAAVRGTQQRQVDF